MPGLLRKLNETALLRKRSLKETFKGPAHLLYHIMLIVLSASIALSLPYTVDFAAKKFLQLWALIGNEKVFLVAVEISLAVALILFFNYVVRNWKDRKVSKMADMAGLVFVSRSWGFFARRKNRNLKESQGIARDLMVIGSTGYRTFADEKGELHGVVKTCREAKIMLLNPFSDGANVRVKSILNPDITLEQFRDQIRRSIEFLKGLKAVQKCIRLKLYNDVPFLKMVISGDYIWIKHYHAGFDVQMMPEYVFRHNQNPGSLYMPFYQYFVRQWEDPGIPEYDLETDELVYRDMSGNEEKRERFGEVWIAGCRRMGG